VSEWLEIAAGLAWTVLVFVLLDPHADRDAP